MMEAKKIPRCRKKTFWKRKKIPLPEAKKIPEAEKTPDQSGKVQKQKKYHLQAGKMFSEPTSEIALIFFGQILMAWLKKS